MYLCVFCPFCWVKNLSLHLSLTLVMFVCMLGAPLETQDLSIHFCLILEASSLCYLICSVVQAFFSFWMAQFICIASAPISRIQLQFFTVNKLSNDLGVYSCRKIICNLMVFSVIVLLYNRLPDCLFEQLFTYGKSKSLRFLCHNWYCVSTKWMDEFYFFK